ncbi:MAG: hypothetical protein JKY13_00575 [Gammaproteobacteria bacterium]|nr:hypothetical protein [Gammaproteobacteria bacterium]
MQLNLDTAKGNIIKSYQMGKVQLGDRNLLHSAIITPQHVIDDWQITLLTELTAKHLQPIIQLQPNIFILGVGEKLCFPDMKIFSALMAQRIGLEIMDNAAACRTYNVLAVENRSVAVGLIIHR